MKRNISLIYRFMSPSKWVDAVPQYVVDIRPRIMSYRSAGVNVSIGSGAVSLNCRRFGHSASAPHKCILCRLWQLVQIACSPGHPKPGETSLP